MQVLGQPVLRTGHFRVVNDINLELTNFWRVLQGEKTFASFRRIVEAIPFSQVEWKEAEAKLQPIKPPDVDAAVAFFVRCRLSRAGEFKEFATLSRNRTRRRQNEQASAW
jgi:DNA adenine methylase